MCLVAGLLALRGQSVRRRRGEHLHGYRERSCSRCHGTRMVTRSYTAPCRPTWLRCAAPSAATCGPQARSLGETHAAALRVVGSQIDRRAAPHPHAPHAVPLCHGTVCSFDVRSKNAHQPIIANQGPPPPNPLVMERFQSVVSQLFQQASRTQHADPQQHDAALG